MSDSPHLALVMDEQGIVQELLHAAGLDHPPAAGVSFARLFIPSSRAKAHEFLRSLNERGALLQWELHLACDPPRNVIVSGVRHRGVAVVAAAVNRAVLEALFHRALAVVSGDAESRDWELSIPEERGAAGPPDEAMFEQLSALNNRLVSTQRELAQRNRDLRQAQEELKREMEQRLEAQRRRSRMQERVRQADRLESLAVLAGGLAHDYNNILCSLMMNLDMARMLLEDDSPLHERFDQMQQEAERAAAITEQMLAYSGQGNYSVQPLQPADVIGKAAAALEADANPGQRVRAELPGGLPEVDVDPQQFERALLNMGANALEAMEEQGGELVISCETVTLDEAAGARIHAARSFRPGEFVAIHLDDEGHGVQEEHEGRLFDPFFTTRFTGRGLGLSAVIGIAHAHGGGAEVHNRPEGGARATLYLPVSRPRSRR